MKLSIIVPCYNEEKNIPLILNKFAEAITRDDIEVILVDNGSTDNTQNVLAELLPQYPFAKTVRVDVNIGYGHGIKTGLEFGSGEFIGYTHADMQTDPSDVVKGLEIIESHNTPENCYAKGRRKGRPFLDNVFTVGMSFFETVYLNTRLWDINAQPNIFHKSFYHKLENPPDDFSLDLYILYMAKKKGLDIVRFNVVFPPRIHGSSKWNTGLNAKWKFIKRTLKFSRTLKKIL